MDLRTSGRQVNKKNYLPQETRRTKREKKMKRSTEKREDKKTSHERKKNLTSIRFGVIFN